ncbi:putative Heterokaryon incompatibility domain-containing protein [Seiridium cardinale]
MDQVYGGAFLTIMAATGVSAEDGLFHHRKVQDERYVEVFTVNHAKGVHRMLLGSELEIASYEVEPPRRRGWAFQEAWFSNRTLIYGSTDMSWECRGCTYRENQMDALKVKEKPFIMPGARSQTDQIDRHWTEIVESYSATDLTFMTDRLPALGGIIEYISREMNIKNKFGLWDYHIPRQLLWKHDGRVIGYKSEHTRQSAFRAPSWSWISVDGRVRFLERHHPDTYQINVDSLLNVQQIDGNVMIIQGFIERISTIRLKLAGRYYGGYDNHLRWANLNDGLETFIDDLDSIPQKHKRISEGKPDELIDVWFLCIRNYQGLILIPTSAKERISRPEATSPSSSKPGTLTTMRMLVGLNKTFKRIGVFTGFDASKWIGSSVRQVCII